MSDNHRCGYCKRTFTPRRPFGYLHWCWQRWRTDIPILIQYGVRNLIRWIRFGPGGEFCELCGFYFPLSQLTRRRVRDGRYLPCCTRCDNFQSFLQRPEVKAVVLRRLNEEGIG